MSRVLGVITVGVTVSEAQNLNGKCHLETDWVPSDWQLYSRSGFILELISSQHRKHDDTRYYTLICLT